MQLPCKQPTLSPQQYLSAQTQHWGCTASSSRTNYAVTLLAHKLLIAGYHRALQEQKEEISF